MDITFLTKREEVWCFIPGDAQKPLQNRLFYAQNPLQDLCFFPGNAQKHLQDLCFIPGDPQIKLRKN